MMRVTFQTSDEGMMKALEAYAADSIRFDLQSGLPYIIISNFDDLKYIINSFPNGVNLQRGTKYGFEGYRICTIH
jgi:hypothetical protein